VELESGSSSSSQHLQIGESKQPGGTPTIDRLVTSAPFVSALQLFKSGGGVIGEAIDATVEVYQRGWRLIGNILLLISGGVSLYIAIGLIDLVNRIPFVETTLKGIGLVMSLLFVSRNLLKTEQRQQTIDRARAYFNKALGAQAPVVRTVELQDPTGDLSGMIPPNVPAQTTLLQRKSNQIDELRYLLLASQVELINDAGKLEGLAHQSTFEGGKIGVTTADGVKCDRCWNYSDTVGHNTEHPTVCDRCVDALSDKF
jgi:CAAD domains of cyanobacterial aminoacyl-tRNA synthetase/Zinc finger found in FPG and IleRS